MKIRLENVGLALPKYLKWNNGGDAASFKYMDWPLQSCATSSLSLGIKRAVLPYVQNSIEFSPWAVITQQLVPAYGVTVVPTYTKAQLELRPADYWALPSLIIDEHEIAEITVPSTDLQPLIGVMISYSRELTESEYGFLLINDGV